MDGVWQYKQCRSADNCAALSAPLSSYRHRLCVADNVCQSLVVEVGLITSIGIIVVHVAVVIIVHSLGLLLAMSAGLDLVILVHTLGLGELVDFTSNEAGEEFFGKSVVDGLAYGPVKSVWGHIVVGM